MKIAIIYSGDLPNNFANSINTIKHADAFCKLKHSVTVFYINKKNKNGNLHRFYDISKKVKFHAFKENLFFSLEGKFWKKIHFVIDLITNYKIRYLFDIQKKIAQYIIKNNFDFVYARNFRTSYYIIKSGIPIVVETHAPNVKNPELKKILALNNYENFKISTISEILKQNFVKQGMFKKNIIVQEDAVDISKFENIKQSKAELREILKLQQDKKIITYSGSLRKGKGINSLLKIAKELENEKNIIFLIVGGPEKEKIFYQKKVQKLNLSNILFTGFVLQNKIPLYLKASDILIMLYSFTEKNTVMDLNTTSPIKLFEYMASKKPIVVSKIPTIAKIIEHNKHALMIKPDDILEIKENVLLLLNNKDLQNRIANNAFELAKNHTYIKRCKNLLKYGKNQQNMINGILS